MQRRAHLLEEDMVTFWKRSRGEFLYHRPLSLDDPSVLCKKGFTF